MKKKGIKPKNENVNEDLRNWFKEKWVDVSKKVTWVKNSKSVARVDKEYPGRLKLSPKEFYSFMGVFSLPWEKTGDDILPLQMILPFLQFEGGTEAIPILIKLGIINEINHIAIPSSWD